MSGADADALDRVAGSATAAARELQRARSALSRATQASPWQGVGADRFRERWSTQYARSMAEAAAFLDSAAGALRQHAAEQRDASSAAGGQIGGSTGAGGSGGARDVDDYRALALQRAGIDPALWRPELGVDGNRAIIEAVYAYYAELYRDHPYMLWAGMAGLIGPSFYGGFLDLDMFADMVALAREIADEPLVLASLPLAVRVSIQQLAAIEDGAIEDEFRWYEQQLLAMQKEIFIDQATQHEAYRVDGMAGLATLLESGHIDQQTYDAWDKIDQGRSTGDQSLIDAGNLHLLVREQRDIINDDYRRMYNRDLTGPAVTYLMTVVGEPSVPGARTFADLNPLEVTLADGPDVGPDSVRLSTPGFGPIPSVGVRIDNPVDNDLVLVTPLPDSNVADFGDRWALIEMDTLPTYMDMPRQDVLDELDRPFGERVDEYRLHNRAPDMLEKWLRSTRLEMRR